jgi:hypothetical protein
VAVQEPIDPRVRLAISQWPKDAPRGAVSTFCSEQGISRKSFYELRRRARAEVLVVSHGSQVGDKVVITDIEDEISPSTPDPHPASATSATADAPAPARGTRERHRSPDTPTATDVLVQNCHRCAETSHSGLWTVGCWFEQVFYSIRVWPSPSST